MLVGLDRLPQIPKLIASLRKGRIALLAHPASVNRNLVHISRVLRDLDVPITRIFGPEHGYGGEAQDMIGVQHAVDPWTGAPIVSLYGDDFADLSPAPEQLEDLDAAIVDLADVGSRYYTFVWTAVLFVRAAHRAGVPVVLLDRPNPIDGTSRHLEGRVQRPGYLSFVGLEPVAIRHGLTPGELVALVAAQEGIEVGPGRGLDIVAVEGWDRECNAGAWDRAFVMPSPNMPTVETAEVYPGGCLLEGTNLSEGRGTTRPFELLGAPWLDGHLLGRALVALDLPGFVARPITFLPTFHKHANQLCGGVQIHVTDRESFHPVATYAAIIALSAYQNPEHFRFRTARYEFVDHIPAIDLLVGSGALREGIMSRRDPLDIITELTPGMAERALHEQAIELVRDAESRRR